MAQDTEEIGQYSLGFSATNDFFHVLLQVAKRLMLGYQLYAPKLLVGE
jgi:hypothetical protein